MKILMLWIQLSHGAFTLLPAPLAVQNRADQQDLGGLQVLQLLGTAHVSGTGSGSAAVGLLKLLSPDAITKPGGRIVEPDVKQLSPRSSKRHGSSVFCAATGIRPPSGAGSSWLGAGDYRLARAAALLISGITSRAHTATAESSSVSSSNVLLTL